MTCSVVTHLLPFQKLDTSATGKWGIMALTRSFKETVQARVLADTAFRDALLREGIATMLGGDVETGKSILRDYIKATVGFEQLSTETGASPKILRRMFGPCGNPQARDLFPALGHLQKHAGLSVHVTAQRRRGLTMHETKTRSPNTRAQFKN